MFLYLENTKQDENTFYTPIPASSATLKELLAIIDRKCILSCEIPYINSQAKETQKVWSLGKNVNNEWKTIFGRIFYSIS